MLASVQLAFTLHLDAGAVGQLVQRALRAAVGDVDLQGILAAARCADVRHRPVQVDQVQQTFDETCSLPECNAEQHLHGQAGLDSGIVVVGLSVPLSGWRSLPDDGGIEPDGQQPGRLSA